MQDLAPRFQGRTLTHGDHDALTRMLSHDRAETEGAQDFLRALEAGTLVDSDPVAPGVVTMNAQVFLLAGPQEDFCRVTLCYPDQADPARGHISVLSPLGSSVLGLSAGQTATWRAFGRVHAARILAVLAPLREPAR